MPRVHILSFLNVCILNIIIIKLNLIVKKKILNKNKHGIDLLMILTNIQ